MRYKLTIEYDGTPFCGWQKQQGQSSVQESLEKALQTALRHSVELVGSGRTDTGVHALGQVAHFDTEVPVDTYKLRESLNALVRPDPISVRDIVSVPDTFHARFSAKQRAYLYRIQNTRFPPALQNNRVWWFVHPLDEEKMQQAAKILIGKHDLSTFRAAGCQAKSPLKTIDEISVRRVGEEILVEIKARSFLYHQVRNIVGSLVYVGCGKWSISDFESAFKACDRTRGGETAPAHGLYFMSVLY
ncbi:MAG: tRNA pseudouridine(38-40) synthase TruA [Alphaproteobacteria bacterium]|nr:tRNA pseudouridine(38-40) synthase TruA [Alphaproteobacteria bacterium]